MNGYINGDESILPTEPLLAEKLRLQRRNAELVEQAKSAQRAIASPPQGQMVSGIYVPRSKWAAYVPVLQQAVSGLQQKALDEDATALDHKVAAAARDHMKTLPPEDAPTAAKLEWAQAGSRIPSLGSVMEKYAQDQLVNAPERQAVRADRKEAREASVAESRRKQAEDLEYKRERDTSSEQLKRDLANDSNDLRRTLSAAMKAAGGGGGGKGSDWQLVTDDSGNVTRVNKLTGEAAPVGAKAGKSQASLIADQLKQGEVRGNASKALDQLAEAERLLPEATGSMAGTIRDKIYGAAGVASKGSQAAAQLDVLANNIASGIPRMAGQVSDADLKFIQKQAGDLANRELPVEARLAALTQVRRIMQKASGGASHVNAPAGPSIRQAVEAAAAQQQAPKVRTYNPATGRLE